MTERMRDSLQAFYRHRREAQEDHRQRRIYEIERRFPQLRDLRFAMKKAQLRAALASSDEDSAAALEALHRVEQAWEAACKTAAVSSHYDQIEAVCSICADSGVSRSGEDCSCQVEARVAVIESSNLSLADPDADFSKYDLSLFNDEERNQALQRLQTAREYTRSLEAAFCRANEADQRRRAQEKLGLGFLFMGEAGTGKSYLASCIASELRRRGVFALFLNALDFFFRVQDYRRSKIYQPSPERFEAIEDAYDEIFESELLILDDIGAEDELFKGQVDFLLYVLNRRQASRLPSILITNLDARQIYERYTERIQSRLFGDFNVLIFESADLRFRSKS
ncbi:MAG: AAA family ATPase [Eubacteriales bacterium]|nr:AAA family ATPase [Eubacteriales bacterium]